MTPYMVAVLIAGLIVVVGFAFVQQTRSNMQARVEKVKDGVRGDLCSSEHRLVQRLTARGKLRDRSDRHGRNDERIGP